MRTVVLRSTEGTLLHSVLTQNEMEIANTMRMMLFPAMIEFHSASLAQPTPHPTYKLHICDTIPKGYVTKMSDNRPDRELKALANTKSWRDKTGKMSNRSRKNRGEGGEEVELWQRSEDEMKAIISDINASNENVRQIAAIESRIAALADSKDSADIQQSVSLMQQLDTLYRNGVKLNDAIVKKMEATKEKLGIVKTIQEVKEQADKSAAGPSRSASFHAGPGRSSSRAGKSDRGNKPDRERERAERERERERDKERERERVRERERDKDRDRDRLAMEQRDREHEREREKERENQRERDRESERDKERNRDRERDLEAERDADKDNKDLYDFDGAAESPHPSPIGSFRKLGRPPGGASSDRSGNRDSVPPRGGDRDTPAKADSAEPQTSFSGGGVGNPAMRAKVVFLQDQDVAFKPKPTQPTDQPDWYLGKVKKVLGEGKTRRYLVKDEDPDIAPSDRKEFRMSALSMIPIPSKSGAELPKLDKGKTVLALYPDSTTFYKAEVTGMDAATGNVNLRFEGEEQSGTQQVVERRYVVDYRD